jgi:hypothetical protein
MYVKLGDYVINLDQIAYLKRNPSTGNYSVSFAVPTSSSPYLAQFEKGLTSDAAAYVLNLLESQNEEGTTQTISSGDDKTYDDGFTGTPFV